jgi:hypothetical protein
VQNWVVIMECLRTIVQLLLFRERFFYGLGTGTRMDIMDTNGRDGLDV